MTPAAFSPRLAALLGIGAISFSAIFVRLAGQPPVTAAFFRTAMAIPVLLLLARGMGGNRKRSTRGRLLALGAGVALATDLYLWHQAIDWLGAGLATVVANTQVVFVGLAAWAIYKERPAFRTLLIVPVIFAGITFIAGVGDPEAYGSNPAGGAVFGLLAGAIYSVFLLLFRESGKEDKHPVVTLYEVTVSATVATFIISLADGGLNFNPPADSLMWLIVLSLGCHVFGWVLISSALTRLPSLETSILLMLQPMLTMVWAAPIFGERMSSGQWLGVALVLGGVAYLSVRGAMKSDGMPEQDHGDPDPEKEESLSFVQRARSLKARFMPVKTER
jgi:drug/metabolite transporter (DMT)-like permease